MTPASRQKTAEAAWLVATGHPHGLAQVRLLKLLWLSELRFYESYGTRLTFANWWRWEHGPYSKDVINTVRQADRNFSVHRDLDLAGATGLLITAKQHSPGNTLTGEAKAVIDDVLDMHSRYSNAEILAEVYADPFFEATPYGSDFEFGTLANYRRQVPAERARLLLESPSTPVDSLESLFE